MQPMSALVTQLLNFLRFYLVAFSFSYQ